MCLPPVWPTLVLLTAFGVRVPEAFSSHAVLSVSVRADVCAFVGAAWLASGAQPPAPSPVSGPRGVKLAGKCFEHWQEAWRNKKRM